MKAFIPVTLLALASATSACTFEVYLEDDLHVPDAGNGQTGTLIGEFTPHDCREKNACVVDSNAGVDGKYKFCINGKAGKDGKVDGGATVQRQPDHHPVVNINPDRQEAETDSEVLYWHGNIKCRGAHAPANSTPSSV